MFLNIWTNVKRLLISGCQFQIDGNYGELTTNTSGVFSDFHYCSWLVTVSQKLVVSLVFSYLALPDCTQTYIDIFDGESESFPLLSRYCGSNATFGRQVMSTGNNVFIVLKAGINSSYSTTPPGFYANYKAISGQPGMPVSKI